MTDRVLDQLIIVLAAVVVGVLVFVVVVALRRYPRPDPRVALLLEQRDALVRGLVHLLPQLPDGLVWQAENVLSTVGVRQVVPDGEPVDPQRHHVVGTEVPADATRVDTVARTIRPGYADGDRLVLHPKVVVYAVDQR